MNNELRSYTIKVLQLATQDISQGKLVAERELHPENGNIIWKVIFIFKIEELKVEGEYFLSGAIDKIREVIEPNGYRVLIKCADIDAAHSGMQADMSAGTLIYKLKLLEKTKLSSNRKEAQFHVLDESEEDSVGTLQEQKEFRRTYYENRSS